MTTPCNCHAERERAYELGRHVAHISAAKRAFDFYSGADAQRKPVAAWALLPLGLGVDQLRALLANEDDEPDTPKRRAIWKKNLGLLAQRLKETEAAVAALQMKGTTPHARH